MSKYLFMLILCLFLVRPVSGQEADSTDKKSHFSVFVESPVFYKDWWEYHHNVLTVNLEYLIVKDNKPHLSFVLGFGSIITKNEGVIYYQDPYVAGEMNFLFGKKTHYFEIGFGPGYATGLFFKGRVGYRLQLGKRLLFRVAYTPAVYLRMHIDTEEHPDFTGFNALSVGLGYRFGIRTSKEKWDRNWKWLEGIQFNWQPFFKDFKNRNTFSGTVNLEFLLAKFEKVSLNATAGFGYAVIDYASSYMYPLSFNAIYGTKRHFAETGIRVSWIPVNIGNEGDFFTLQPEIGYRFHFIDRFYARVAYTPYWWLSNKAGKEHIEKPFVNSATIGIGWHFH